MDVCADYLLKYAPYLQSDEALRHGAPIATGVIKGACGHLVEDRMNLTGARWSSHGRRGRPTPPRAAIQWRL